MIPLSIIIPVYNESENISNLVNEIWAILKDQYIFEILIVNDGSIDDTNITLDKIVKNYHNVNILSHSKNMGQSKAIQTGILYAKNDTIITLDGDGQNNPIDMIILIELYNSSNFHLVGGIRTIRKDSFVKKVSSKIANSVRQFILKDNCKDTGCSLKIFSKSVYKKLPYFDGNHRFMPALFKGFGFKTKFISVDHHRQRLKGISKYRTLDRLFKGIKDIIYVRNLIDKRRND